MESLSIAEELPAFPIYLQEMFLYKPPGKRERGEVLIRLQRLLAAIVYFTRSTLSAGIIFIRPWVSKDNYDRIGVTVSERINFIV